MEVGARSLIEFGEGWNWVDEKWSRKMRLLVLLVSGGCLSSIMLVLAAYTNLEVIWGVDVR